MFRGNRDYEYNSPIDVKDNVKTVVTTVPKVPHELKTKLENKLKRMVDLNIIQPIEKPTDWVIGLVILKKTNSKLHIGFDAQPMNNAIKCKQLHFPTDEEIFSQMSGAWFFSKLDAFLQYCQIKEDEEAHIS